MRSNGGISLSTASEHIKRIPGTHLSPASEHGAVTLSLPPSNHVVEQLLPSDLIWSQLTSYGLAEVQRFCRCDSGFLAVVRGRD